MKYRVIALWVAMMVFGGALALGENNAIDMEKAAGMIAWLIEQAGEIKKQQDDRDKMLWMFEGGMPAAQGDAAEIAAVLEELGVGAIADEIIESNEQFLAEDLLRGYERTREQLTLSLLYSVGMGEYDEEYEWHPTSETVLAMDLELFGSETLYGDFFKGLNAICQGVVVFSGIEEDYSDVNMDEGTGTLHVSFLVNGEAYSVDVQMMYDWFDMAMFNAVSDIISEAQNECRLYGVYDGMQGLILFYNTPEWAKEFEKRTGCPLFEEL